MADSAASSDEFHSTAVDTAPAEAGSVADSPRPALRSWVAAAAFLTLIGAVIPYAITRHYGATGIPRNDDWSYLVALFRWVDTGHLDFNNWVSMTLLGQLVIAAPVVLWRGHSIASIQLLTTLLGLGGLFVVTWLGWMTTRTLRMGVFVAALMAAGPLWGALTVSFMTDVPTFAISMLACAFGVRALVGARVSIRYLVASLLTGVIAFTLRQYAAVPVVATALVGTGMLIRERDARRLRWFLLAAVVLAAAAAAFWGFWSTIPHPKAFSPGVPTGHSVRAVVYQGTGLVRLLGLLVAPVVVVARPARIIRRSWAAARDTTIFVAGGAIAVLTYTGFAGPRIAFAGNYIAPDGILAQGVAGGHRPDIFPAGIFPALLVVASASVVLLCLACVPFLSELAMRKKAHDLAPRDPVTAFLGITVAGYGGAYFLAAATGLPLYDRYILPVVPIVALLLLRQSMRESQATEPAVRNRSARGALVRGAIALVVLGLVGLVYTADSASFDGTRWAVASDAVSQGWSVAQVRGGFEWVNFYTQARVLHHRPFCVFVIVNPPGGVNTPGVIASAYYRSPLRKPVPVVAIRSPGLCSPARPPAAPSR